MANESKLWEQCLVKFNRQKPDLQKRYPGAYICIAVTSGNFGVGFSSPQDREGYLAAFKDFESKCGKPTEATLFLGCKL